MERETQREKERVGVREQGERLKERDIIERLERERLRLKETELRNERGKEMEALAASYRQMLERGDWGPEGRGSFACREGSSEGRWGSEHQSSVGGEVSSLTTKFTENVSRYIAQLENQLRVAEEERQQAIGRENILLETMQQHRYLFDLTCVMCTKF